MNWITKLFSEKPKLPFNEAVSELLTKRGEVVLADGRFATIYEPKLVHLAKATSGNQTVDTCMLLSMTVTIDDKFLSVEDYLNMDVKTIQPIMEFLGKSQ